MKIDPNSKEERPEFIYGDIDDNFLIHVLCPLGHKGAVVLDSPRYQILLRSASYALLDGHRNEAIAVLSAALERCYEFYIRVVLRYKEITSKNIEAAWKSVTSQSERQLGAFMFIYLLENNESFVLHDRIPQIRNRIVHKGHIASEEEAAEYSELVYTTIRKLERLISEKYAKASNEEAEAEVDHRKKMVDHPSEVMVMKVMPAIAAEGKVVGYPETFREYMGANASGRKLAC